MAQAIQMEAKKLKVPDTPIIPFIEGDGIGRDIWSAAVRVFNAAVERAYNGKRRVEWLEVLAGQKAYERTGNWLPEETIAAFKNYLVGIKGPLTTPVSEGFRSLNVSLRQRLDLYACVRPIRYFPGVPSPVKRPEVINMIIFRENTEDVYSGKEVEAGSEEAGRLIELLYRHFRWDIPSDAGIGIKPISETGSKRLIRAAIDYAIKNQCRNVTLVHKGNIMKFTEGAFRTWGYEVARKEYPYDCICWDECGGNPPKGKILIQDVIADNFLQQVLIRPEAFDVIATMNLNGDYLSDALAAQVGGIGIAPGANINDVTGHALFEATHGTAPKYADLDKVNPGSIILSGELMFRYLGWSEVADMIVRGLEASIASKQVTYDFARLMEDATELKCSEFASRIIETMQA